WLLLPCALLSLPLTWLLLPNALVHRPVAVLRCPHAAALPPAVLDDVPATGAQTSACELPAASSRDTVIAAQSGRTPTNVLIGTPSPSGRPCRPFRKRRRRLFGDCIRRAARARAIGSCTREPSPAWIRTPPVPVAVAVGCRPAAPGRAALRAPVRAAARNRPPARGRRCAPGGPWPGRGTRPCRRWPRAARARPRAPRTGPGRRRHAPAAPARACCGPRRSPVGSTRWPAARAAPRASGRRPQAPGRRDR